VCVRVPPRPSSLSVRSSAQVRHRLDAMVESDDGQPPDGLRAELEAGRAAAAQGLRQLADRIEALPLPDSGSASVDSGRAEAVASGSVTHLRTPGAGHAARACVGVPRPRAGYAPLKADAGKAAAPVENGASRRHVENAREGAPHDQAAMDLAAVAMTTDLRKASTSLGHLHRALGRLRKRVLKAARRKQLPVDCASTLGRLLGRL
jgi:hypothetical protein